MGRVFRAYPTVTVSPYYQNAFHVLSGQDLGTGRYSTQSPADRATALLGVTAIQNPREPFKKSSMFSTPISQRLDEIDPQYNNLD
ncbi:hypothetical protein D4764_20G0007890 [Takifugu flavidus]|uniref:Uncharacterized protein n=1 Tax=Takifugu flavidus TaxID=433684 RepID=A0A5C6NM43_9TELE|nr:hypothetical protein D4764_20G0007890 [Takifugu flavidus]